jgi:FkbM family methyltransferase
MTTDCATSIAENPVKSQGALKRLVLAALVSLYAATRRAGRVFERTVSAFDQIFRYLNGVHLLILERIAEPRVQSLRLTTITAGEVSFRMALLTPGLIEDLLIRDGAWEPHLMELMSVLMPAEGVFIDVGANIGCHSLHIASRYPGVRCHGFEPHPEIFRQLTRNAQLSSLENLTLHRFALGRTSKQGSFYAQDMGSYNRGLSSAAQQEDLHGNFQETVIRFEPLDDVLSDEDRAAVRLIKIDTQGGERDVLLGAAEVIEKACPTIIFEFESRYHADPEQEMREIMALLPRHEIFYLKADSTELRTFDAAEVRDRRFEADLVCLPLQ